MRTPLMIAAGIVVAIGILALPFVLVARVTSGAYPVPQVAGARFARFADGVVRYELRGQGEPALLLLHAYQAHLGQWEGVWERIEGCPGRQLRIDVPGFGESEWSTGDYGIPAQAERVVRLLDTLGIAKATVVGTSMGASLAAGIAAAYPERVEQVGMMAPSGYPGSLTYPGLFGRLVKPGLLNRAATWIARTSVYRAAFPRSRAVQSLSAAGSYGEPWMAALSRIRAPVLIAWSRGDPTAVSVGAGEGVRDAIAGSTLVWLDEQTGHSIPNERPELAAEMICRLAQGVPPADVVAQLPPSLLRAGEGIAP